MNTRLITLRPPTAAERKRGAEVVFIRRDHGGRDYKILACRCWEGWEQWGAPAEVLADNVDDVEGWRRAHIRRTE